MSFSRFVWLLKNKRLWLSRADQFDDAWEMMMSEAELERVVDSHLIGAKGVDRIEYRDNLCLQVAVPRMRTFINCWTASDSESAAMWKVYCRSTDGVAIQTTLGKLQASVGPLGAQVFPVEYKKARKKVAPPKFGELFRRKLRPYSYEKEQRIVMDIWKITQSPEKVRNPPLGHPLPWDPERYVNPVLIHPAADDATTCAIKAVVEQMAPKLLKRIVDSAMAERPPMWIGAARRLDEM